MDDTLCKAMDDTLCKTMITCQTSKGIEAAWKYDQNISTKRLHVVEIGVRRVEDTSNQD